MVDLPALNLGSEPSLLARSVPFTPQASMGLGDLASAIWRRKLLVCALFALVFAAMSAFVLSLPSQFTSNALMLADPRKPNLTDLQTVINPGTPNEDVLSSVRSDVQILESDGLAHQVIEKLHLDSQPEFLPKPSAMSGLRALVTSRFGLPQPVPAPDAAFVQYQKNFSASNDGKSYVISTSFSAADPALAQRVLGAHLAAYLDDQRASKEVVIGRAQSWLDGQLAELGDKVSASEERLQDLVNSDHLSQAEGATVGSRELAGTATQLNEARADLARKRARAQELADLARLSSNAAATSSDALASPLIQKLREQEAGLAAEATQLSERLGAEHPTVLAARAGLANVQQKIRAEISRMAAAAANEVAVASATVASARHAEAEAELHVAGENSAGVAINQIQRDLDAERKLYADLLARSKQLAIQREIQEPDAQIVSPPNLPLRPSSPHRGLLLLMSAGAAALLASMAALVRDRLGNRSQSLSDIEALCGLNGLGVIPQVPRGILRRRHALLTRMSPLSALAAAVQTVRNSIAFCDLGHVPAVIAFGSALPGEGKTTLVTCFGYSLAQAGRRVLLVDADLRRPGLTWLLASRPHSGIVDVLEGRQALHEAAVSVPRFGFDVLAVERAAANPHDLLQSPGLRDLLDKARAVYDVVLIDTPPVSVVDDALAVMRSCDVTALVVRWGRTPYEAVRATGRRLGFAKVKIAGVVLNAVALRRYHASSQDLESYRPSSGRYYLQ